VKDEELRESQLDTAVRLRELELRQEEYEDLLEAIASLAQSNTLERLMETCRSITGASDVLLVSREDLRVVAATREAHVDHALEPTSFLQRALGGAPLIVFDLRESDQGGGLPEALRPGFVSMLVVPLPSGLLVCGHPEPARFDPRSRDRLMRLAPLAQQALLNDERQALLDEREVFVEQREGAEAKMRLLHDAVDAIGVGVALLDERHDIVHTSNRLKELCAHWGGPRAWWRVVRELRGPTPSPSEDIRLERKGERVVFRLSRPPEHPRVLLVEDMTVPLHERDELRRSEALLKAIVENTADFIWSLDRDRRLTAFNRACALEATKHGVDLRVGHSATAIFPPSIGELFAPLYERVFRGEAFRIVERVDGDDATDLEMAFNPITVEGEVVGASVFARNITVQKRAEDQLRASESLKDAMLRAALDCVITIDAFGNIVEFNPAAEQTFGWSREEALGREMGELIVPEELREGHRRGLARYRETGVARVSGKRIELPALHRDGHQFPVELAIIPLEVNGALLFTAYLRDVTTRKEAEAELKAAKEDAEEASRAKSRFLATMSHEIRTPMNAILGMTELVLGGDLSGSQRELLQSVFANSNALLHLINDLLEYSRLEVDNISITPAPTSIADLVFDTVEALGLSAHAKGLEVSCFVDPRMPPSIVVDPVRLRQVLVNLIGNAIKFTQTGGVDIRVELDDNPQPGRLPLCFEVRDTGVGIPEEDLPRVFDRFFRGEQRERVGGAGLGLSVVQSIADRLGGAVEVESSPSGTTFRFRLDLPFQGELRQEDAIHGMRVLVVESGASGEATLERYFGHFGANATFVRSLTAALKRVSVEAPEGVLVSRALVPQGSDAERALVSSCAAAGSKLFVLSSPGSDGLDASDGAGWRLLSRPVRPERLVAALSGHYRTLPPARPVTPEPHERPVDILVVEDNADNRHLAREILEKAGHRVTLVENGARAVQETERHRFDLVLMDVEMPVLDGISATREIRAREARAEGEHVPIVALTAHAVQSFRDRAIAAGVDHYMTKPILRSALLSAVETYADRRDVVLIADDFRANRLLLARQLRELSYLRPRFARAGAAAVAEVERGGVRVAILDLEMPGVDGVEAARRIRRSRVTPQPGLIALTGHGDADTERICLDAGFDHVLVKPSRRATILDVVRSLAGPADRADPAPAEPRLDLSHVDPDLSDLIPPFFERQVSELQLAKAHLDSGEHDAARRIGHNLKGSAGGYGFPELGSIGAELEAAASSSQADEARRVVDRGLAWLERARAST
jgi:PAS domain S-box-containing protein